MESELRERHIKWITNAKMTSVSANEMTVQELDENGALKKEHKLPFAYSAVIPAFKGVDAVAAVPGLCNPRGFVLIDKHQRNPKYKNIYSVGVCVAIPPVEATPVPTGAPKTGYMIESMVSATAANIAAEIAGQAGRSPKRPGMRFAWRTSATPAPPSSRCRRFRRATSPGRRRANGCIWRKLPSKNTSCARCAPVR